MVAGGEGGRKAGTPDPAARLHELRPLAPAAVLGRCAAARRALEAQCGPPLTDSELLASEPMFQMAITQRSDCQRARQHVARHTIEISETELAQASFDEELLGRGDGDEPARVTKTSPPRTRRAVLRRDRGRKRWRRRPTWELRKRSRRRPTWEVGSGRAAVPRGRWGSGHAAVPRGRWEAVAPPSHVAGREAVTPPSHVGAADAVATPSHVGAAAVVAPPQVAVDDGAPPVTNRRRRARAPAAGRTPGSQGAWRRVPTPARTGQRRPGRRRCTS